MGLFGPGWMSKDLKKAERAIGKLTEQKALEEVVLSGALLSVRLHALQKIRDEAFLERIALQDEEPELRIAAVGRLENPAILKKIALRWKIGGDVNCAAIRRIRDQAALYEIASAMKNSSIATAAVNQMNEPALLMRLAQETGESEPLERILQLFSGTGGAKESEIATEAIMLRAGGVFENPDCALHAISHLADQPCLKRIALSRGTGWMLRAAATKKLEDQTVLVAIARNSEENDNVVTAAIARLEDQDTLEGLCRSDNWSVRCSAVMRIKSTGMLEEIKNGDPHTAVREHAEQRLKELNTVKTVQAQIACYPPYDTGLTLNSGNFGNTGEGVFATVSMKPCTVCGRETEHLTESVRPYRRTGGVKQYSGGARERKSTCLRCNPDEYRYCEHCGSYTVATMIQPPFDFACTKCGKGYST